VLHEQRVTKTLAAEGLTLPLSLVRRLPRSRRWRIDAAAFRGDRRSLETIGTRLRRLDGVERVDVDVRSGRILVVTDGSERAAATLTAILRERPQAGRRRPRARGVAPIADDRPWHAMSVGQVFAALGSSTDGLGEADVKRRRARFGCNVVDGAGGRSRLGIFAAQLANVPTALLIASSSVSLALGEWLDAVAIGGVLSLNTAIGYVVERSSETLLALWTRAEEGDTEVLRDGRLKRVATADLVPGDVVALRAGDVVPADVRLTEARRLACDEAAFTGESEPQLKRAAAVAADTPLADRTSMGWSGAVVVGGRGRGVVVATGDATELARVQQLIDAARAPETPLARRLARLGHGVAAAAVGGAAVQALAGLVHGRPVRQIVRGAVALGLAALPEGLPVVSTSALVRSMARMRKDGMVVRRLASAETLGGVTVICADKTGTLTKNEMQLELVDVGGRELAPGDLAADPARLFDDPLTLLLAAALLNSDVDVARRGREVEALSGSATERALVGAALAAGLDGVQLRRHHPLRRLWERQDHAHYVVSVHGRPGGGHVAFIKGAPEQVIAMCERMHDGPLDGAARARLLARNAALASRGLRVLALAWRPVDGAGERPRGGFRYLGMAGLRDPLREGARDAILAAARAGIRTILVTGDQQLTAAAIAREVGLDGDEVLSRVTPADKLALVEALRARGEVVAMCGDGVNDAPALKAADVGVAVGQQATDLARRVADVVLASEDLRAVLDAVAEGRIVQDNLRRAIRYLFATNLSEMMLMVGAAILGARDPLTPLQLLWINMLTDTLPALALALERGARSVLARPPAAPSAPLFTPAQKRAIGRDGTILSLAGAAGVLVGGPPLAFGTLAGAQLAYTLVCRAPGEPLSPRFATLVGGTAAVQLAGVTLPPLRALLGLSGSGALPLAGFTAGFALPWLTGRLGSDEIVRYGRRMAPADPCRVGAATQHPRL
jgi:P-type Ca2+ transporter type 2C